MRPTAVLQVSAEIPSSINTEACDHSLSSFESDPVSMEWAADFEVEVPPSDEPGSGVQELTFDGLLSQPLRIDSDGGAAGCGGKLWPAGDLLSRYLIRNPPSEHARIVELGSGTGLAGLALAQAHPGAGLEVWVTDQTPMVPLMQRNIELNGLSATARAAELDWGEPLPDYAVNPDVVLAADCVYLEAAFPLLERTLLDLTAKGAPIFMAYKKRRKADRHFFRAAKKHFIVTEIEDFPEFEAFHRDNVHLFKMTRKSLD